MSEDIKYSFSCTIEGDATKLEESGQKYVGKCYLYYSVLCYLPGRIEGYNSHIKLSAALYWFNTGNPAPTWLKNCWLGRK